MAHPDDPCPPAASHRASHPDPGPTELAKPPLLDRLVDAYLSELAQSGVARLEDFMPATEDEAQRSRFMRRALAEEFLWRRSSGEAPSFDEFQGRLLSEEERAAFAAVVRDAELAQRLLPSGFVPGALLGDRYEILREVGRGGMGVVFAAFDRELEREVAVKVFNQATSMSSEDWETILLQESKTLAKLNSRNIVAIHDARRWRENSYIVMDLVRGPNLAEVLERVRQLWNRGEATGTGEDLRRAIELPREADRQELIEPSWYRSVARLFLEVVRTIELAHERGVIHRDLKPTNILVVGGGEPVLLDFGLSAGRTEIPSDDERGFCCTPSYVPPERARDLSNVADPRGDVYQLGLVLYELLTLELAYEPRRDEALFVLLQRITSGKHRQPRDIDARIPKALEAICEKALETDPTERYQDASELREDLERHLRWLPPRHARIGAVHALGLRSAAVARSPLTLGLAAVALAVLAWVGFARDEWLPPELDPFRHAGGSGPPELVSSPGPIDPGTTTILGVRFRGEDAAHLYVFSFSGGKTAEERTLHPVLPERFASLAPPADPGPAPIEVAAGEHWIACAVVGEPEANEGLLVFACEDPDPTLALWQESLHALEQETLAPVPYLRAMAIGRDLLGRSRGESLGSLSAETRLQLFGEVKAAEGQEGEWRIPGVRRYLFVFQPTAPEGPG